MPACKSLVLSAEQSTPIPDIDAGRLGRGMLAGIGAVGAGAQLAWACLRALRRPRIYLPLTFAQVWEIGISSLPLVLLVAMISGRRRLDDARPDSTVSELAHTARSLTGTPDQLRVAATSLASILGKLDQGYGTLGRALNDPSLYEALLTAATHADEAATGASALVRDVRARPERHVRVSLV